MYVIKRNISILQETQFYSPILHVILETETQA